MKYIIFVYCGWERLLLMRLKSSEIPCEYAIK